MILDNRIESKILSMLGKLGIVCYILKEDREEAALLSIGMDLDHQSDEASHLVLHYSSREPMPKPGFVGDADVDIQRDERTGVTDSAER